MAMDPAHPAPAPVAVGPGEGVLCIREHMFISSTPLAKPHGGEPKERGEENFRGKLHL